MNVEQPYRFILEGQRQEWPTALINGLALKRLGNQDAATVAVFLKRQDEGDQEVEDDDVVDLAAPGIERFYFRPAEHTVSIIVNEQPVNIARGDRTGLQIKEAAIAADLNIGLDFVLTLHKASGQTKIIGNQDAVRVHRGQRFTAVADDDKS